VRIASALAAAALCASTAAAAPDPKAAPSSVITGEAKHDAALDPVFKLFKLDRMRATFTEEKSVKLLAHPLRSTGTIVFSRDRGVARLTTKPKVTSVVITPTTLKFKDANHSEEIPLDKSKDLKAFALIFPSVLRGDRVALEKSFAIGLYGSDTDRWALVFTPKTDSLKKLVAKIAVYGTRGDLTGVDITETSGDTTVLTLSDLKNNGDVADSEITAAFGAL
jgi:outer membrane lipoprotein-sorting protein